MSEQEVGAGATAGATAGSTELGVRIRDLIAEQLGVEQERLVNEANILDDLGADSLDVVELVMAIEDAFDIEVPDDDVENMRTVGDVEKYVSAQLSS